MNKDELRIRIIPEDGQVLIETYTDGIVKCKEIQEDALLDCLKTASSTTISAAASFHQIASTLESIQMETSFTACGTRGYMQISAIMKRHIRTFLFQDWSLRSTLTQRARSAGAGWALLRMNGRQWRP